MGIEFLGVHPTFWAITFPPGLDSAKHHISFHINLKAIRVLKSDWLLAQDPTNLEQVQQDLYGFL
jgi:hypothetical protein